MSSLFSDFLSANCFLYFEELHVIDGIPQLIFVRSNYTIEVSVPPCVCLAIYDFF
jgi:hypothetical protein